MNSLCLSILSLVFLVLIQIPPCLSSRKGESMYESCSKYFNCGNLTRLGYPFWGGSRSADCGHPKLELHCQNDVPTIDLRNVTYRVLHFELLQFIKIAREDLFGGICNAQFVDSVPDPLLFEIVFVDAPNVTILYGCPPWSNIGFNVTNCEISGLTYGGVRAMTGAHGTTGNCNSSVTVIIDSTAFVETVTPSVLEQGLRDGFSVRVNINEDECTQCLLSGGQCGYDRVYNRTTCFCPDLASGTPTCNLPSSPVEAPALPPDVYGSYGGSSYGGPSSINTLLGILAVVGCIIFFLIICYCLYMKCLSRMIFNKERNENHDIAVFLRNFRNLAQNRYKYSDVKKMTNSFRDKLGQGGYGCVYKGKLSNGQPVAVKVLSEAKGNGEEFINEVASISTTSHVNIVSLLGFCYEGTKRALIYEFMPNGSLDKFIYSEKLSNSKKTYLEWKTLYEIAVGVARGLEYLHRGCTTRILHFDIKPHNILLDEDFYPKISDFGLAKLCQRKQSIISMSGMRGTIGYIAPEVFSRQFGGVSYKSDVYSYGMMILEMVVGRENIKAGSSQNSEIYFPDWIYKYLESGVKLKLHRSMIEEEEELARKMILVGLWCIQTKPLDRPSMTKVVEMLEGSIDSLQIPPKPFRSSPPRSPQHFSSITSSSQSNDSVVLLEAWTET